MTMARPFFVALVSVALLGWMAPTESAAPCAPQEPTAPATCPVHTAAPCCAGHDAPAQPSPMDPSCALRCAQLHAAIGLAPAPSPRPSDTQATISLTESTPPHHDSLIRLARLTLSTHAPPRRYALLCNYRC